MVRRNRAGQTDKDAAWTLANQWVAAWNAHDLDAIMAHYDESVELTSPVAALLLTRPDGHVVGNDNLRAYFQRGLEAHPHLHFRRDAQRPCLAAE